MLSRTSQLASAIVLSACFLGAVHAQTPAATPAPAKTPAPAATSTSPSTPVAAEHGMNPVDAYMLCSVCGDLRISEIVDMPNWVVSFYFPRIVLS